MIMEKKNLNNEDVLLKLASEYIDKEEFDNDITIDREILKLCMDYDKKQQEKKKLYSVLSKVAVVVIALFLSFEVFMPETAQAFHTKLFGLVFDERAGSLYLNSESEREMIADWTDYNYPEYIPQGFVLSDARKKDFDSILLYENTDKTVTIRIMEESLETSMSLDTETTEMKHVQVGIYKGYLFTGTDYDGVILTWIQNDRRIIITTNKALTEEELVKIGENLIYVH